MSKLDAELSRLGAHEGVEQLILLGRDGLVVQHTGGRAADVEPVAARVPGLAAVCDALGEAASRGRFLTSVLEHEQGVLIVLSLPRDLLLAVLVRPQVGFAPLLRELRSARENLVRLL